LWGLQKKSRNRSEPNGKIKAVDKLQSKRARRSGDEGGFGQGGETDPPSGKKLNKIRDPLTGKESAASKTEGAGSKRGREVKGGTWW